MSLLSQTSRYRTGKQGARHQGTGRGLLHLPETRDRSPALLPPGRCELSPCFLFGEYSATSRALKWALGVFRANQEASCRSRGEAGPSLTVSPSKEGEDRDGRRGHELPGWGTWRCSATRADCWVLEKVPEGRVASAPPSSLAPPLRQSSLTPAWARTKPGGHLLRFQHRAQVLAGSSPCFCSALRRSRCTRSCTI